MRPVTALEVTESLLREHRNASCKTDIGFIDIETINLVMCGRMQISLREQGVVCRLQALCWSDTQITQGSLLSQKVF